ncbi:hypothetical protein FE257_006911 [Aspergillus nanangensis]|uniref:Uncharacterized protein n=1 Tax=Aspergillus nanangensis TaxID=2582783 RepID=A0AAD4CNN2_ASPNN|nr:hypothetical protein FE257_006911 [Aspergillus nanangensis]
MFQSSGRALGASANHTFWLRASPFICALDAVALVVRLLTYCFLLEKTTTPGKAMLIIGADRFNAGTNNTAFIPTISRLVPFLCSVAPLVSLFGSWGKMKWTVAWAWMYIASYAVMEIVMRLARYATVKVQEAAADFELEGLVGRDEENGETAHKDSAEDTSGEGEGSSEGKEINEEDVVVRSTEPEPAARSNRTDLEAANEVDPVTSARLLYLNGKLDYVDGRLLRLGGILHAIFLCWAFLDLAQPFLESNLLASEGAWTGARQGLSIPMMFVALFAIMFIPMIGMFIAFLILYGLWNALLFSCPSAIESTANILIQIVQPVISVIEKYRIVGYALLVVGGAICALPVLIIWVVLTGYVSEFLWSSVSIAVYELICVAIVMLIPLGMICLVVHFLVASGAKKYEPLSSRLGVSQYLEEWGVSLLTAVLITFTVSILWYKVRYASFEHGKWVDNWQGIVDANSNQTHSSVNTFDPPVTPDIIDFPMDIPPAVIG